MEIFTVNDALARLDVLNNRPIYLEGLLSFQFEDISLNHHPRAEYRNDGSSSIWIDLNCNILRFESQVMNRWHGKRVLIEGILQKSDSLFGGSGHMCLWSASIIATEIELFKSHPFPALKKLGLRMTAFGGYKNNRHYSIDEQ